MARELPLVRTSERSDFKRCPWLWEQSWLLGLTTRRTPTWSWFGTAWHSGMEAYYPEGLKRGSQADAYDAFEESLHSEVRKIYTEGGEIEDDEVVDGLELGKAMLKGYFEEYGEDDDWEVIGKPEQSFQIWVPHPSKKGEYLAVYCGTWDLLIREKSTGLLKIVDHKTRKTFPGNWAFYTINDQAGSYLWVAPEVLHEMGLINKKKDKIEGLIFNAARKHMPDSRPRNAEGLATNLPRKEHYIAALEKEYDIPAKITLAALKEVAEKEGITVLGDPSTRQPSALFHREEVYRSHVERVQQGQRVQQEVMWMEKVRSGEMPAFKTPTEDCNRCQLFEYCEADEQDKAEGQELARTLLFRRDPYRTHRDAMEHNGYDMTRKKKGKKK